MWLLLALMLLVLPRFFLIPIEDTGVRTEDILLLLLIPGTAKVLWMQRKQMGPVVRAFALYFGIVIFSSVLAGVTGKMSTVVALAFGLRPALYACAFIVGYRLSLLGIRGRYGLIDLGVIVLILNLAWGIGTSVGILPNVASFHPSRLSGLTNGPYELSAMLCLFGVAFLACRRFKPLAGSVFALIWTQSRAALAAFVLQVLWSSLRGRSLGRWVMAFGAVMLLFSVATLRDTQEASFAETMELVADLGTSFFQAALTREDYFEAAYSDSANSAIASGEGDPSALIRVARWSMVWATAVHSVTSFLFGMGPGYYSVALDGNYVRLVGETGLLGLLAFVWVGVRLYRSMAGSQYQQMMLSLLVQLAIMAIFIDVFVSLKIMCLFWMFVGALQRERGGNY